MLAVDDDTVASADKYKVAKMSDLGAASKDLVLGGPPECLQRLFCLFGLQQTYGTQFKAFKPLDAGGPLTVAALDAGEIDVGLLFTTDQNIALKSLVDERTVPRCVNSGQLTADKRGGRFLIPAAGSCSADLVLAALSP